MREGRGMKKVHGTKVVGSGMIDAQSSVSGMWTYRERASEDGVCVPQLGTLLQLQRPIT